MRARSGLVFAPALLSCGASLDQTTVTYPPGRAFLDGVCVSEAVADYVACVRAQGAQLGAEKAQKLSADVSTLGVRAAGAAQASRCRRGTPRPARRCSPSSRRATAPRRSRGVPTWVAGRVGGAIKLDGGEDILVDDNASQHSARAITVDDVRLYAGDLADTEIAALAKPE
jgi:hypothetical protein